MNVLKKFQAIFSFAEQRVFYASQPFWEDQLNKKMFEYNLHLNPPQAARVYAAVVVATYNGFIACFDATYAIGARGQIKWIQPTGLPCW